MYIISYYILLYLLAAKLPDYQLEQETIGLPKHVDVRWLTLSQAIAEYLEWDGLLEYFLKTLPKQQSNVAKVPRYTRIKKHLDFKVVKLVHSTF